MNNSGAIFFKFIYIKLIVLWGLLSGLDQVKAQNHADSLWSFGDIRTDANADDTLDYLGREVTVTGIANIETGLLHEQYLQASIQNDSAGMSIFSMEIHEPFKPGDSLIVNGRIERYNGLTEVHVDSYRVISEAAKIPDPKPLEEAIYHPEKYLGMLIEGAGKIIEKGSVYNGKYLRLSPSDTASASIMIYVSNFHHLYKQFDFDMLSIGDKISVRGIMSEFDPDFPKKRTFKVFLRTPEDLSYIGMPRYYLDWFVGGLAIVFLLVVGWVASLRKQVGKKTGSIRKSLEEKDTLLREIHHRVKNSLAIVSGLIGMQIENTDSSEAQNVLKDSQSRIHSVALIHEKLYHTESLSDVSLDNYLKELVEAIHSTFTEYNEAVDLKFDLEAVEVNIDKVIPCGLLINELVVNAFKHAFKKDKQGVLEIGLHREKGHIRLTVADNGPGLPGNFSLDSSDSLGAMLISTFAAQLEAEITINNREEGAEFAFTFPENEER